jgi:3'-5' exonuclease
MPDHVNLSDILFLDIETVPLYSEYSLVPEQFREHWKRKSSFIVREPSTPEETYQKAGIYAEFGKIICISTGIIYKGKDKKLNFRIKSFFGDNEKEVLESFIKLLNDHYNKPKHLLCAHNGKEFDFPFLARRILINGLKIPKTLAIAGKKPWEVPHLDTMELWKFGDYKHYSSLDLLAAIFNIPCPKNDISGKDVAGVYYQEKNLKRIVDYCQRDVLTVAQVLLKFRGEDIIGEEQVSVVL